MLGVNMKVCMKCNENYDDDFVFCPKCGSNLITDNHLKCPNCEKELDNDFIFCPYCGYKLNNDLDNELDILKKNAELGDISSQIKLGDKYSEGIGVSQDYEESFKWYMKAAEQGDEYGQYSVGCMYAEGQGIKQDYKEAFKWYMKAAGQDNDDAQYRLGEFYYEGKGVEINKYEAFEWFKKASDSGNILAELDLEDYFNITEDSDEEEINKVRTRLLLELESEGKISREDEYNKAEKYYYGDGVEKDYEKALELYMKAAMLGMAEAQNDVGECYYFGKGTREDREEAFKWYKKAAKQGDAYAQYNLGYMYHQGIGVIKDKEIAFSWFMKSAEQENNDSQFWLGKMYGRGEAVEKDDKEAFKWYMKAAEAGNADAQYELGECYLGGKGVGASRKKALNWYREAAEHGNEDAKNKIDHLMKLINEDLEKLKQAAESGDASSQIELGDKYIEGCDVEQDYNEALNWYLKAAEQGDIDGQLNAARMYEEGNGIKQNLKEAFNWYLRAAEQRNDDAQYCLGQFYYEGKGIDINKYEAFEWFKKAADNGNIFAGFDLEDYYDITEESDEAKINDVRASLLLELGNKYFNGIDADKDLQKATAYYQRAAALGNEEAKTLLKKLDNYNIETKTGKENSEQSDTDDSTQEKKLSNPDDELELGIAFFKNKNFSKAYEHLKISDKSGDREAYIWLLQDIVTNIKKNDVNLVKKDITEINLNLDSVLTKCKDFKFKDTFKQMCNVADYLKSNIMYSDYKYKSSDKGIANDMIQQVIVRLYECAGQYGDADSLHRVGLLYENGDGVEKNYELARACYEKAASQGNLDSIYRLGNFYHYGKAMAKKDLSKAREFYQKAVDQGLVKAFTGLAIMYFTGEGVERDYEKAFELFSKAVDTENPESEALYLLGFMYENEFGVQRDYDKAKGYYQQALKGSYLRAADGLKRVEEKLKRAGVNQNRENKTKEIQNPVKTPNDEVYKKKTELEVCIERANKGDMNSILRLGDMYYFGNGNEKDHIKAAYWYRTAAEKGDANAQFNLAAMYQSGDGVPQNEETAKEWYQKAAENGHEEAKKALRNLQNDEEDFLLPAEDEVGLFESEEENSVKVKTDEDLMIQYELARQYESNAFIGPLLATANFDDRFTMSWKELRSRIKGMKLINQEKYNQVIERYRRLNREESDEWKVWNSNFYAVVDELTNHKLAIDDIFELQDFLDEILRGHLMEIAISVEKQDAGRMLVGLMDTMGTTSHLTMEEKRWLACAVIVMTYVGSYDEKTRQFLFGIFEFTSVEEFRSKYNCGYGSYFFETADNFPKYDQRQPFGYSIQNPVTAPTVMTSAIYLKSLRSKDGEVSIRRLGTVGGSFSELLDKYEVTVTKKHIFSKDEKTVNYLYVNEFGLELSFRPPEGFYLQSN